jgi:formate dehydrogenase major subunit
MKITRRDFLKASGATACAGCSGLFGRIFQARADATRLRIRYARQTTTICPYCGCGCGLIVSSRGGKVINTEGDPDHPINEGSLCAKGSALYQVANNPRRLKKVRYRAKGSDHWEEVSWNWAINRITQLVKNTRDKELSQVKDPLRTRINSIAAIGGAALDTEECYLYSKLMRALGVVYIEHQARI